MSKSPRSNRRLDKYVTKLKQHYKDTLQASEEDSPGGTGAVDRHEARQGPAQDAIGPENEAGRGASISAADSRHAERMLLLEREVDRLKALEDKHKDELARLKQEGDNRQEGGGIGEPATDIPACDASHGLANEASGTTDQAPKIKNSIMPLNVETAGAPLQGPDGAREVQLPEPRNDNDTVSSEGKPASLSGMEDAEVEAAEQTSVITARAGDSCDDDGTAAVKDDKKKEEKPALVDADEDCLTDSGPITEQDGGRISDDTARLVHENEPAAFSDPEATSTFSMQMHEEEHLSRAARVAAKIGSSPNAASTAVSEPVRQADTEIEAAASGKELTKADRWKLRVSSRHAPKDKASPNTQNSTSPDARNSAESTDQAAGAEERGATSCGNEAAGSDGDLVYRQIVTDHFKYVGWTTQSGQPHSSGSLCSAVSEFGDWYG